VEPEAHRAFGVARGLPAAYQCSNDLPGPARARYSESSAGLPRRGAFGRPRFERLFARLASRLRLLEPYARPSAGESLSRLDRVVICVPTAPVSAVRHTLGEWSQMIDHASQESESIG
jgi:hypothetical protein